ncbi:MAG: DUF6448 family protein [Candidatus Omnitrophota bacterium]
MNKMRTIGIVAVLGFLAAGISLYRAGMAFAHCDTMKGPVVVEAKAALEKGDVVSILKWVKKEYEAEIKSAFAQAIAVRAQGAEAKALADRYFLEILVRLHRSGEGASYDGLKDEPLEPIVAMADMALADGSADDMIEEIAAHMKKTVQEKFHKVLEAQKSKDKSVEAGREFVEAYVTYMHYVEGIHSAILSAGGHHHAEAGEASSSEESHAHKE